MSTQQLFIKCAITKKNLSISKEVARTIEYHRKKAETDQKALSDKMSVIMASLSKKYYVSETKNMKIAVRFNNSGQIDEYADPKIELVNALEKLSPETKAIVEKAISEVILNVNDTLAERTRDLEAKFKEEIKQNQAA